MVICLAGSLDDRLHYFETLHHDSLRHRITKRDVEDKPHDRILEYHSHNRLVQWHNYADGNLGALDPSSFFSARQHAEPVAYLRRKRPEANFS